MYCPRCGRSDQQPESYCIACGIFLPDLDKAQASITSPKTHLNANITLSGMTIVVCLTLIVLNWIFAGNTENIPIMAYVTWGFLFSITAWHIQSLWRAVILRRHFVEMENARLEKDLPKERHLRAVPANDAFSVDQERKRTTNRLRR